jgi:hypothetical protein
MVPQALWYCVFKCSAISTKFMHHFFLFDYHGTTGSHANYSQSLPSKMHYFSETYNVQISVFIIMYILLLSNQISCI